VGPPTWLASLLLAIGYAQTARTEEAAQAFEEAIARASAAGDHVEARLDTANLAVLRGITGDIEWAVTTLRGVVAAAPDGAQDQFPSLTSIVELELQRADLAAAREYAARAARAPALNTGHGSFYLELEALRAGIELEAGDLAAARSRLTELVDQCRAAANLQTLSLALERLAVVQHQLGDVGQAESSAREALVAAERMGYRSREIDAEATLAEIVRDAGRPANALELCARALAWARDARVKYAECRTLVIAARARRDLGDLRAAAADARTALKIAERCGYRRLRDEASALVEAG
jgi:tetratricopeptide (TPR) repeat protein